MGIGDCLYSKEIVNGGKGRRGWGTWGRVKKRMEIDCGAGYTVHTLSVNCQCQLASFTEARSSCTSLEA